MPRSLLIPGAALLALLIYGAALLAGRPHAQHTGRALPWLQRASMLPLVGAAWLGWAGLRGADAASVALLVAAGLTISFVADLIMAELIPVPNRVIGGMVVFALAHCCYIAAWRGAAVRVGASAALQRGCVGAALICGALAWWRWVRLPGGSLLSWGALGYLVFLTAMAGLAFALVAADRRWWPVGLGAALFLLSDAILGNQVVRKNHWPWVGEAVWLSYLTAQIGLLWSLALV